MNQWIKIALGLVLIVIPLTLVLPNMAFESWGRAAVGLLKGGITILVLLFGITLIALGINDLKG